MKGRTPSRHTIKIKEGDGGQVSFRLVARGELLVDWQLTNSPKARVRYPLPEKGRFLRNMQASVADGLHHDMAAAVRRYLHGRDLDIAEDVQTIRRAVRRIERALECKRLVATWVDGSDQNSDS